MSNDKKPKKLSEIIKKFTKKYILDNAEKEKQKAYDIRSIYQQMELDLISSMKRAFYYHQREQEKEGFEWEQWQLSKLRAMEDFRKRNKEIIGEYSEPIQEAIDRELRAQYSNGEDRVTKLVNKINEVMPEISIELPKDLGKSINTVTLKEDAFFGLNEKKLEALISTVKNDLSKAEHSVLRRMDDIYRQTLFKTQVYMQSGVKTLNQAIDMATKDFLDKGIDSIEYKNGRRVNIASYAEMCLRTASQRATFLGEGTKRNEYSIHTVVVSAHANTCPHCAPWQGKVLIDDVFSNGSSKDGAYPLLSEAIKKNFLHPNCRHTLITYFPGITKLPQVPDEKEAIKTYEAEQKQRYYERQIRKWKRVEAGSVDIENQQAAHKKVVEWTKQLKDHIDNNKQLRRNYDREKPGPGISNKDIKTNIEKLYQNAESAKIEEARSNIKNGVYNLSLKTQKQQEHILGTKKWLDRVKNDISKGKSLADAFFKDIDIQALIKENSGTGIIAFKRNQIYPVEYISIEGKYIGVAFDYVARKYVKTNRFAIRYSSKGVHAHPVLPRKED